MSGPSWDSNWDLPGSNAHYRNAECAPLACAPTSFEVKADIVTRLRGGVYGTNRIPLCIEAADEIERLREYEWKYKELCK